MVDEMVDIVNEQDEIMHQTTKKEAHEKGLLHRTVIAELIDSDGNWTLVKQAADRQDPFTYVSPAGGHVLAGESEDEGLKREAGEELGLRNFNLAFIKKVIFNRYVNNRQENHYFIVYEIYSDQKPVLNEESTEYKKFTPAELKKALKEHPEIFGNPFHFIVKNIYPNLLS